MSSSHPQVSQRRPRRGLLRDQVWARETELHASLRNRWTIARAHLLQKRFDEADRLYARAVANLERTHGPYFDLLTKPLLSQGLVALARPRDAPAGSPEPRTPHRLAGRLHICHADGTLHRWR